MTTLAELHGYRWVHYNTEEKLEYLESAEFFRNQVRDVVKASDYYPEHCSYFATLLSDHTLLILLFLSLSEMLSAQQVLKHPWKTCSALR